MNTTSAKSAQLKIPVSVDCVIFGYDSNSLKILLIECNTPPYQGQFSLLGEFIMSNEHLDEAASRILHRWTGMRNIYMEQLYTFSALDRHPEQRVISVAYYSLLNIDEYVLRDAEHKSLQWIDIKEIENLAFDHNKILNTAHQTLKESLQVQPIGFNLLPDKFSLKQLQTLYELILEIKLDKRNFRRKLLSLQLLNDTGELEVGVPHRPARLYRFDFEKYASLRNTGFKFEI